MRTLYVVLMTVAVLSAGAFAQPAPSPSGAKPDSAAAQQQAVQPSPQQPSLNKQVSVSRTTKKTNWSKIKTLFE
jgi:hypothetical protein